MTEEYPLVKIEWADITHLNRVPDIEFVKENKFLHFTSLGFLIYEDKEMISIAFSYAIGTDGQAEALDKFRDVLSLPKSIVKKVTKLKELKSETNRTKRTTRTHR